MSNANDNFKINPELVEPYFILNDINLYLDIPIIIDDKICLICKTIKDEFYIAVPADYWFDTAYNTEIYSNCYYIFSVSPSCIWEILSFQNNILNKEDKKKSLIDKIFDQDVYIEGSNVIEYNLAKNRNEDVFRCISSNQSFLKDVLKTEKYLSHVDRAYVTNKSILYGKYIYNTFLTKNEE